MEQIFSWKSFRSQHLDAMHFDDAYRGHFVDVMLQLTVQTAIIPKYLVIRGVTGREEFPITTGGFGVIWKAYWKNKAVALKMLRQSSIQDDSGKMHRNLCKEVLLWRQLAHPNLLGFVGICEEAVPSPAMVSLWMENGSVLHFSRRKPMGTKLRMLSQVARALAYLHTHNPVVVHQDVRCANILVNDSCEAVLSDFGLSRLDNEFFNSFTSSLEHGCLRWQAPELVFPDSHILSSPSDDHSKLNTDVPILPKPSTQTDIYALGMTALELFTEKKPFSTLVMDTAVVIDLYHHRTPARPLDSEIPGSAALCDDTWQTLMTCWSMNPAGRPSAKTIGDFFATKAEQELEERGTASCQVVGKWRHDHDQYMQARRSSPPISGSSEDLGTRNNLNSTLSGISLEHERPRSRRRVQPPIASRQSSVSSYFEQKGIVSEMRTLSMEMPSFARKSRIIEVRSKFSIDVERKLDPIYCIAPTHSIPWFSFYTQPPCTKRLSASCSWRICRAIRRETRGQNHEYTH
ncbi:kinase-like protein [Schizopora paradoxa]|uniref:Kinase-like protein n=1 Tax=Schizopora paradoxa TaxID=27342 RepID=A0A0H2RT73_9AGAM|nr:kinase-like protein [Schizopora paradoxa]